MEGELNTLIEQNNLYDKKFEVNEDNEDDFQSSLDIKEFEKRIKAKKTPKILPEFIYNDNNSSSSSNNDLPLIPPNYEEKKSSFQTFQTESFPKDPSSKIEIITKEIISKSPPYKEEYPENSLLPKNEALKDRKLKELLQKNKALTVAFEREKALRVKSEKEFQLVLKETEGNLEKIEGKPIKSKGEIEDYKGKYLQADKKVQELRFEKQSIKNELNKAMRVLTREIGENFNLDEVFSLFFIINL